MERCLKEEETPSHTQRESALGTLSILTCHRREEDAHKHCEGCCDVRINVQVEVVLVARNVYRWVVGFLQDLPFLQVITPDVVLGRGRRDYRHGRQSVNGWMSTWNIYLLSTGKCSIQTI